MAVEQHHATSGAIDVSQQRIDDMEHKLSTLTALRAPAGFEENVQLQLKLSAR